MYQEFLRNAFIAFLAAQITFTPTPPPPKTGHQLAAKQLAWVVFPGESLSDIAQAAYGNQDYWKVLWNDNAWIEHPGLIEAGWALKIRSKKPEKNESLKMELAQKLEKLKNYYAQFPPPPNAAALSQTATVTFRSSNYDQVYREAGEKFGVPWQILYGLHMTETGLRDGEIYNHQGSGAQGPMQFMPGTWRAYGVDGDGDGVANINNAKDAIFGAANFIAKHGSVNNGLRYYGGNTTGTLAAARSRGYNQ